MFANALGQNLLCAFVITRDYELPLKFFSYAISSAIGGAQQRVSSAFATRALRRSEAAQLR